MTPVPGVAPFALHGPDLQEMDVWRMGIVYADVFEAISGVPLIVTGVRRMCDGCDRTHPGFVAPTGWVAAPNGDDLCTHCLIGGDR